MTNKSIIYYEDGQRKIISIAPEILDGKNNNKIIESAASKLIPEGVQYEVKDSKDIPVDLADVKNSKKAEIKALRNSEFQKPLQIRSNPDIYLKPKPETNIFMAAYSMADNTTKEWRVCDIDGVMQNEFIEAAKDELMSISNHYEERKTLEYNQYHKKCDAVEALETIEEVESFDINQIIV